MDRKYYILRIELLHTHQPVWREVQVPSDILLSDLHYIIQMAMGWEDEHVAIFDFKGQVYESLEFGDEYFEKPREATQLNELLKRSGQKLTYIYDLGDDWRHSVTLKKTLPWKEPFSLICLGGEGACPMEDCGGVYGYEKICNYARGLADADDDDLPYEDWGVGDYDPDAVDLKEINAELAEFVDDLEVDDADFDLDELAELDELFEASVGPRWGQLFDGFGDADGAVEEEFCPEPYTNFSDADRRLFRKVMEQAEEMRALTPWKDLWDQDIFCIQDPNTGLLDFVSILGRGGEVFALHVHHGVEAYEFWRNTMLGTMPMDPSSYIRALRLTEVEFVNKAELEPDDLNLYERSHFPPPLKGRQRWLKLRRYHPRAGAPWFATVDDLPRLLRAMRLCGKYLGLLRQDAREASSYLRQDVREGALVSTLPCFRLTAKPTKKALSAADVSAWEFYQLPMNWDEAANAHEAFAPSEFDVQRIASLPVVDEVWEVGAVELSNPVATEAGPAIPILAVAISLAGMLEPPQPHMVTDLELSATQALWEGFVAEVLRRGARPSEVHVGTPAAEQLLQSLESVSSTRVVLQLEFQQLGGLLSMMSQI